MKWVKYTETFNHGYGRTDYMPVYGEYSEEDFNTSVKETLSDKADAEYWWAEGWRGYKWEVVDKPPAEWIAKKIEAVEASIVSKGKFLDELRELL